MPISDGNAWVVFRWGGTDYSLPYANITAYEQKPMYAEDGYTLNRYEVTVQGSALVSDGTSTFTDLATKFKNGTGQLERLRVRITSSGGTENLLDVSFPDTMRGPMMSITVTEVNGRRACVVNFTAVAALSFSDNEGGTNYPAISHRWTSRFSLDATGLVTRTVSGVVTVDLAATGTDSTIAPDGTLVSVSGKRPWADLLRKAILPAMSFGGPWRRESQTFAYNEAGNGLIYEVTDSQARTDLPDAAFSGTAEFTYERTRQALAFANLRFSCTLEGAVGGDVRNLIAAAIVLAQSRISFSQSIINRLVVTEQEMLKKAQVRLELDAQAPALAVSSPSVTQFAVPLANLIGRHFSVSRSCDWRPDPYGGADGVAGIPHWYGNNAQAKPYSLTSLVVADVVQAITADCPAGVPTVAFLGDTSDFTAANAEIAVGPYAQPLSEFTSSGQVNSVERQMTTTTARTQTRMHRLQTLYTQGADFVFQAGKAAPVIEETTTVRRVGSPPTRVFRPIPAGFMVIGDDWKVNHGDVDATGHRTFTGIYTRTLMAYDGGGSTSNGYSTVSGRRQWWSPTSSVGAPLTLGYEQTDQQPSNSVLSLGAAVFAYQLGTAQNYA